MGMQFNGVRRHSPLPVVKVEEFHPGDAHWRIHVIKLARGLEHGVELVSRVRDRVLL
jgi:hypothetical protein